MQTVNPTVHATFPPDPPYKPYLGPYASGSHALYLMRKDALYANILTSPLKYECCLGDPLTTGGWQGELSIDNGYVYLLNHKKDVLYGAKLSNDRVYQTSMVELTSGGWAGGKIDVDNGHIYLMRDGNLYGAKLSGPLSYATRLKEIATGGWSGEFAVSNGHVYLAQNDRLYAGKLNDNDPLKYECCLGEAITTGGWDGRFDVHNGYIYAVRENALWAAKMSGPRSYATSLQVLTSGGWDGDFAVSTPTNIEKSTVPVVQTSTSSTTMSPDWPNFDKTLHNATVPYANEFQTKIRHSYSGPDWTDDGCSVPDQVKWATGYFPVIVANEVFKEACIQHDFGYRNVSRYARGRTDQVRQKLDDRFKTNMEVICGQKYNPILDFNTRNACFAAAQAYYLAVDLAGKSAYFDNSEIFP